MTDADEDAYVCQRTADWCDRMLIEFDHWQANHPDAPLVDIEPAIVCRGLARRMLRILDAGDELPRGSWERLGEATAAVNVRRIEAAIKE
ncbi:MAG: hypothetical protein ACOX1P_16515 [Thermoguttaceae bacterium]|jgi:hypothetical protein